MSHELVLSGLDASNSLGFLAALGTLRTLALAWPDRAVKLAWDLRGGKWTPVIQTPMPLDAAATLEVLTHALVCDFNDHPAVFLATVGTGDNGSVRCVFEALANKVISDDGRLDWLPALMSDLLPSATSQLQTVRRDYFIGNLRQIMANTKPDHLLRALFVPWDYADPLANQSLHFEPAEDRRHAHQWHQPTSDPTREVNGGMLGANRLAIEAWPLLPSWVRGDKLATRGFTGAHTDDTRWTWPVWSPFIGLPVIASLLALRELQDEAPDRAELRARGIEAAFRCRRILFQKTPNFTPAQPV